MIWNTIAHPKMMDEENNAGAVTGDTTKTTIEGVKYADPHKLAFFDLLVDASVKNNPKLIHGDFETVKNKILNHELVVGGIGIVFHEDSEDSHEVGMQIDMGTRVAYNYTEDVIVLASISGGSVSLLPDNTVRLSGSAAGGPVGPGGPIISV